VLHAGFAEKFYFLYNIKAMDHLNINLHTQTLQASSYGELEPEHILFVAKKREMIAPKSRANEFCRHLENKTGRQKVYVPVGQQTPWK
jgi:hypothetical protein